MRLAARLALTLGALPAGAGAASAQHMDCSDTTEVLTLAEQMPQLTCGAIALHRFLAKSIATPPGPSGRKSIAFTVQRDGSICNVSIQPAHDAQWATLAREALLAMPAWQPGRQRGEPVNVRFYLPLFICLR